VKHREKEGKRKSVEKAKAARTTEGAGVRRNLFGNWGWTPSKKKHAITEGRKRES